MALNTSENLLSFFRSIEYDWNNCVIEPDSGEQLFDIDPEKFEIPPKTFLEFAKADIKNEGIRGQINALSNVKRSIECQMDIILYSLKIPFENKNFPQKLEILENIGISSPGILQRINRIRVDLEHFYKSPKPANVIDAIDVAHLFLDATLYPLTNFSDHFSLYVENEKNWIRNYRIYNGIDFQYDDKTGEYEIEFVTDGTTKKQIKVTSNNLEDYQKLVSASIEIGKIVHFDDPMQKELAKSVLAKIGLDV